MGKDPSVVTWGSLGRGEQVPRAGAGLTGHCTALLEGGSQGERGSAPNPKRPCVWRAPCSAHGPSVG